MQANIAEAELEYTFDATLGEGPVWDEQEEILYWVDILSGSLFQYDPSAKTNTIYDVGEHIGCLALRENGGLVMALQSGFAFFDSESEELTRITNPESHLSGHRFNDGKCDPSGRFWAGTLSYDLMEGAGCLYCLNDKLNVDVKLQHLTIPNGLAWNKNRTRFFFIDTSARKILAYDYDDRTGEVSDPTVIRIFDKKEGYPDGMTIDREDKLWVAFYGGGKVSRIDPASGEILFEVQLPVPQTTSCTFGGADFNELYITTGREHMSGEEIAKWPLSGSLFKAALPFKGSPAARFVG